MDNVGCRDVIVVGKTGYLVEKKSVSDLVEKLEMCINLSYNERREMGRKGREYVSEHYSMDKIIDIYKKEIEESVE